MTDPLPLNPAQREAVEHPGGPLLVLAGAGSGKTRVLTARIAHLITALHVAPQRIFAVTFTNKAAGEMRTRIGQLLGADPRGLWIGTFHSLSARLLRREAPLLGFGPNFTIYDTDDSEALVKRLLEARQLSTKVYPPRTVHAVISSAKNRMLTPEELGRQADTPLVKVASDIYAELGPALKQANAMDFDDLLLHPLTLFREHPERLAYWQDRFQHVLVDEFQDTNAAQYLLVKHLASRHGNLCVVGDDAEIAVPAGEVLHQQVLRGVRVLELVHEHMLKTILPVREPFRMLAKQCERVQQEIVEIHRVGLLQRRSQRGVDVRGDLDHRRVHLCPEFLRRQHAILGTRDHAVDRARRVDLGGELPRLEEALYECLGVV